MEDDGATAAFFKHSKIPTYRSMYNYMQSTPNVLLKRKFAISMKNKTFNFNKQQ
jgi:hypothetical protein